MLHTWPDAVRALLDGKGVKVGAVQLLECSAELIIIRLFIGTPFSSDLLQQKI